MEHGLRQFIVKLEMGDERKNKRKITLITIITIITVIKKRQAYSRCT